MKIIAMNAQDMAMITIMMLRQTAMQRLAMIVRTMGGMRMTNETDRIQNAIRHIQTAVDVDPWAMEIAVEAMEKQTPKKPNETTDTAWGIPCRQAVCPECDCYLGQVYFLCDGKKKIVYCENCGQAVDFSEWEEGEG